MTIVKVDLRDLMRKMIKIMTAHYYVFDNETNYFFEVNNNNELLLEMYDIMMSFFSTFNELL